MKTKIILQIIALGFMTNVFAQDAILENTNQSLVYLNPSFAGSNGGIRMQNNYRNQWPNIPYNIINYQTCTDVYLKAIKGGLAFTASSDNQSKGLLKTRQFGLVYAQHCSSDNGKLKITPSFQLNYVQINLDIDNLGFHYPYNYPYSPPASVKKNLDLSTGLLINYKDFFIGGTVKHFNQPDLGVFGPSKWPPLYRFHTSYTKKWNDKNLVQAIVIFNGQGNFRQLLFGTNAVIAKYLLLGLSYYNLDALTVNVGYRDNYVSAKVGYGAVLNRLAGNTAGTWQFSCAFSFVKQRERTLLQNFETW
jgi:type IX secretion system PorP/SprF family membrane protein